MSTILRTLATANPSRYITGQESYDFFLSHFALSRRERELYRRLMLDGPIRGRHIAVDHDEQVCQMSPEEQSARFLKFGTQLAAAAARKAMENAPCGPEDVAALVVSTCTGYACPGLSSYVAEELGLGPGVRAFDLVGMGCGSAIPNLQCASGLLGQESIARQAVLSVSVEVCSATIFMGPQSDLVVSNSLFGDGAAAALLHNGRGFASARSRPALGVRLIDFESGLYPRYREHLRYRNVQGRLRNVLSKRVPVIAARTVKEVVGRLLQRHGLAMDQVNWWAVHPGGTAVLDQVGQALQLPEESLRFSDEILREYGNMSSPSVLFVLKRILERGGPKPGQRGVLLAFGAGFSAHAALAEFCECNVIQGLSE